MNSVVYKIQYQKRGRFSLEYNSCIATVCLNKRYSISYYYLSFSIYAVGYGDVSSSKNLFVAANPDFTSLTFEEISEWKELIPLDIHVPTYDSGVKCCCFNECSDTVAVATGSRSVYLLDMQTHNDIQSYECNSVVGQLQRGLLPSSWLGCVNRTVFSFDPRDDRPLPLCSSANAFSLSPNKQ